MCQRVSLTFSLVLTTLLGAGIASEQSAGFTSIDTGYTNCKVRSAVHRGIAYIVARSYEGTVLGISYDGRICGKNELSGFMNRDLWCEDISGDGSDEILAANADGVTSVNGGKNAPLGNAPSEASEDWIVSVRKSNH